MENLAKILPLNSSSQNELMAWDCLKHSQIGNFKKLLQNGMPLTAFMLTTMVFFDYPQDDLKAVLKLAKKHEAPVLQWMQNYFTVDELAEVLPHYQDDLPSDWPSNEDCARLKLWEALSKRKCYDVIAKFAPEIAEQKRAYRALIRVDFAKYAPICLKNEWLPYIMSAKDGWKYLIDNGKVDFVLSNMNIWRMFDMEQEIIDYCLQQGFADTLYELKMYDELLSREQFDVFVKNHSFYSKFLTDYPDKVDWEDLWKECTNDTLRNYLKERARVNKHLPKCHDFLRAHSGILGRLSLF